MKHVSPMRRVVKMAVAAFTASVALLVWALTPALADPVQTTLLQPISNGSPFGASACGVAGQRTPNSVGEPSIAVNPRDPQNIIAVYQQDRFVIDGGALSNLVGVSRDGGKTWKQVEVPGVSRCTGGTDERTSDPWVSIGPDGTAYLATLTFTEYPALAGLAGPTAMRASRSTDGGLTWSAPTTVVNDNVYDDRESVTADPRRAGSAYYVWVRRLGILGEQGVEYFSSTADGGSTWSTPRPITVLQPGTLPDPALIKVLPDGSLLNLYLLANATPFLPASVPRVPWIVMSQRSTDQGLTWSVPVQIAGISPPSAPVDPGSGAVVRAYNEISADVAPDGSVYVAWNVIHSQTSSDISFSRSQDGGRTWSAPRNVASPATQAFLPTLAVSGQGVLGVTWDDFRNYRSGSGQLATDVWFAHSHDGGATWQQSHVAGSFDTLTAPPTDSTNVAGRFLGDFQGLAGLPSGWAAVFSQGRPQAVHGGTDIFFARLQASTPAGSGPRGHASITLRVRPGTVRVGARSVLHFRASSGGRPLSGVIVRLAGVAARTDARGRALLRITLHHSGTYRAQAAKPGYSPGAAAVHAIRATTVPRTPPFTG